MVAGLKRFLDGDQAVGSDKGQFPQEIEPDFMLMKGETHGQEEIKKERQEEEGR